MSKYVLSFDKFENGENPFDQIVRILHGNGASEITSVLESTFIFVWGNGVQEPFLNSKIGHELSQICYYSLTGGNCFEFEVIPSPNLTEANKKIANIISKL